MPDGCLLAGNACPTWLEKGGAVFVSQESADHAIYSRVIEGRRYSAPVQMGNKSLDPVYCKRVLRQLKFTDEEIEKILAM
ncbi:MAG: type II toxin-antitoxin system HicA family toxin [Planctomycetes bacterium]|nr:type II toxin-antitoxin system HicA family toxin [Planctomycetota bacterium]